MGGGLNVSIEGHVLTLVVFDLEAQRYAVHVSAVDRVVPMVAVSPLPRAPAIALGVINIHGAVVPVLDLRRRLGCPPRDHGLATHLLIARTRRQRVAMPVDQVVGVSQVAATAVTEPAAVLAGLAHVAGIVALPDGLLFIHDLDAFLSLDEGRQLTEALADVAK